MANILKALFSKKPVVINTGQRYVHKRAEPDNPNDLIAYVVPVSTFKDKVTYAYYYKDGTHGRYNNETCTQKEFLRYFIPVE